MGKRRCDLEESPLVLEFRGPLSVLDAEGQHTGETMAWALLWDNRRSHRDRQKYGTLKELKWEWMDGDTLTLEGALREIGDYVPDSLHIDDFKAGMRIPVYCESETA